MVGFCELKSVSEKMDYYIICRSQTESKIHSKCSTNGKEMLQLPIYLHYQKDLVKLNTVIMLLTIF